MGELPNLPYAFCLALIVAIEPTQAQTDTPEQEKLTRTERALARTRQMLEQRPTHAALFDRYFKLLVDRNEVHAEIKTLKGKLAVDQDEGLSVVIGRLLLRIGNEDEALEVLDAITARSPKTQGVLGDIYFKLARFDSAVLAYSAALPGARVSEEKRVLYEKLGKAQLALGRKDLALETWQKIGRLDEGKFYRRLYVAELLADAGLLAEAAAAYEPLLTETESDPPKHCQVLRDYGRLQELQGNLEAGLKTYGRVLALTGRGNWLRKEVEKRIIKIYHRTGRLEELVARLQSQVEESPNDLASSELLANVLIGMRELEKATAVLAAISPRFPKDVRLARRVAELHIERKDYDSAIREYQRILSERPEELDLYLELGTLFARNERFNEAKNQWEKALAQRLDDASLCSRLASMYALWGHDDDAIRLYERAIELEEDSVVRYIDLTDFLYSCKRDEAAVAVLDRALGVAAGKARRLEILASPLREHGLIDRAQACLESIIKLEPDNQETRYALADLLLGKGEVEKAMPLLWTVVDDDDRGSGHRTMAANTLVNLHARSRRIEELLVDAEKRSTPGAAFVAGRAHTRLRRFDLAIKDYETALERNPKDIEARRLLARLKAEEGDFRGALAAYDQLAMIAPGEKRRHFREVARLHLEMYDVEEAMETWRRAMRENPDNASVFITVGREFLEINRVQEALEAFQQAARLRPRDPDILLRLASAMRKAGKHDEAEKHYLTVATDAMDYRDRAHARNKLFDLYAEQGKLDKKIETLQAAVAENPYDKDAPQLLAFLYKRTGDLVLGLEMVDRSVKFQPRNKELLSRRAELLESLEDWDKAREVHEELVKFPDADRDEHLAGIGRALYEVGRAEEAKATFREIRDRGRVRRLYNQYQLYDEAIEFYRRAIARNPRDLRSYFYLAEQLEKRSERKAAIDILERCLNIRPYYQKALGLVGKLYVQEGRRDDAIKVGMRMFGLRGEQVEKTRREELEEEDRRSRRRYYYSRRTRQFSQRRLTEASSYFQSRGLKEEWAKILLAEARRRPTDETLFSAVQSYFQWEERNAGKFEEYVRELLARDFTKIQIPPRHTQRSFRAYLEQSLVAIWSQDVSVAEDRIEQLAGDDRSVIELLERAKLSQATGQLDNCRADLEAALAQDGDCAVAHALLVEVLVEQKDYASAVPHLKSLIDWWAGAGKVWHEELDARKEKGFRKQRKTMLDGLPRRIRRRVTTKDLHDVIARTEASSFTALRTFSFPEAVPSQVACVSKLIATMKAAKLDSELADLVATVADVPKNLAQRSSLGKVLYQQGFVEQAKMMLEQVIAEADQLAKDPIQVYFWGRYKTAINQAAEPLGEMLAEAGRTIAAYQMLRDHGHGQKAELLLKRSGKTKALVAALEQDVGTEAGRLTQARESASGDLKSVELDFRDAVIKHADYYVGEKAYEVAESIYVKSLDLLPDDLEVRKVLATLRDRRGDFEAAIAMHEQIVDVKRRRKRAAAGDTSTPPTRLQPTMPGQSPDELGRMGSSSMAYFGGSYYYSPWSSRSRFNVTPNYTSILQIYTRRNDHKGILDTLRKIMQEDPKAFRDMSYSVLDTLRNQDLGKKKLPILRILKGVVKDDDWLTLEYAMACREEGELKEAERILEKMVQRLLGTSNYYLTRAEKELEKVSQRMGDHKKTVDDLRAEVAKAPENVRHRMRLARRLKKDHAYDAALIEAEIIVEKAPYMTKAKEMVVEAAAAARSDSKAIAMLRKLFDESTSSSDKLRRGVNLANWIYAEGKRDEAVEIINGLELEIGGSQNFSPGNWFVDKNKHEDALEHYKRELDKNKSQQYRADQLRQRVARLEMATGEELAAVARYLTALDEAGSLQQRETRWKDLLLLFKKHPHPDKMRAIVESVHGKRVSVEDLLVMAASSFALGEVDRAEADIKRAVEISPKEVYLFPLLFGLRQLHDDYEGSLAILDQMARVYGGSSQMQYQGTGIRLSERDRLKLVRAGIYEKMGRDEEVQALLESLIDETVNTTYLTLSNIYKQRKSPDKALEWRRKYSAKMGTKQRADLIAEANLLIEMGRIDEALELVEEAFLMARGDSQTRSLLIKIHRERDELPKMIERIEQEFAKDFRDASLRSSLITLYKELDRIDDVLKIYHRMLEEDDLRETALTSLASHHATEGEYEKQLEYLTRSLELKGGKAKKRIHSQIATVLVTLGRIEAAEKSYRESIEEDTADGFLSLGRWLQRQKREEAALLAFRKVIELDKDNEAVLLPFIKAAWRNKQFQEVLDRSLDYLDKMRGKTSIFAGSLHTYMLDALAGLDDAPRAKALAGGEDLESRELAAVLHAMLADFPAAERHAELALELDKESFIALDARVIALRRQGKLEELLDATEAMRDAVERAYVVHADWTYSSKAQTLQKQLGLIHLEMGDDAAAEEHWLMPHLRRTPYSNPYYYYNGQARFTAENWLDVRRPEKALEALGREFLRRDTAPWSTYTNALREVGRLQDVEEFAWQRLLDPMEFYGIKSDSYGWIWVNGDYRRASGMQEFLVELYRKQNRLDELETRARVLLENPRSRRQAKKLLDAIATRKQDERHMAQAEEERWTKEARKPNSRDKFKLAKLWHKAGETDKALEYMRKILDFKDPVLKKRIRETSRTYYSYYERRAQGRKENPFSLSFSGDSSYWSSSYSYSSLTQWRRAAASMLFVKGDRERALAVEKDMLDLPTPKRRQSMAQSLATSYMSFEAYGEAIRMFRLLLETAEWKLEDTERTSLLARLATTLKKSGDIDGARLVHVEQSMLLAKRLTEAPGEHAFSLRGQLLDLLISKLEDYTAATEQVDFLLHFKPRNMTYLALKARILAKTGNSAEAIRRLRELSEFHRRSAQKDPVRNQAWLALALFENGEKDQAKRLLGEVTQRLSKTDDLKQEVDRALASLD